jgi:hypothetical protein
MIRHTLFLAAGRNFRGRHIHRAGELTDGQDEHRNDVRDQGVFDRGRAALVLQETLNQLHVDFQQGQ